MNILVSVNLPFIVDLLVEHLRALPLVSFIAQAPDTDSVLASLMREQFDLHLVGADCMPIIGEISRRVRHDGTVFFEPKDRALVAFNVSAAVVLEARRLGFPRVLEPTPDFFDRIVAPRGSALWSADVVDDVRIGGGEFGPRLGDVCVDEVDRLIIGGVVAGLTDIEIAEQIHYNVQSVRNRVSRVLHRSGFRNRTELAVKMLTPAGR